MESVDVDDLQQPVEMGATPSALPADGVEAVLVAVWKETLGVAQVGPEDNFFDLGGQSGLLIQVHALLQERLGREVPLMHLFQFPTVRSLAQRLERGDEDPATVDETAQAARERAGERREMRSRRRDLRRGR